MSTECVKMTFEEFKARCEKDGNRVIYDEHGKHGWTSVEDILDRKPGGRPGPHWCDASHSPRSRYLIGTYSFNTQEAKFFYVK